MDYIVSSAHSNCQFNLSNNQHEHETLYKQNYWKIDYLLTTVLIYYGMELEEEKTKTKTLVNVICLSTERTQYMPKKKRRKDTRDHEPVS